MHIAKLSFFMLAITIVNACGFHLRGSQAVTLPDGVEPIYIGGSNTNSPLHVELRRLLKAYDVRLSDKAVDSNHQLIVLEQSSDRRSASIGRGARAAEIQLIENVSFQLQNNQGEIIIGPEAVTERRILRNDPNQVASTSSEENLLRREMLSNLAAKVVRQVNAADFQTAAKPASLTNPNR